LNTVVAFAFFQGRSRACKRTIAPLGQPGDGDIRLPGHQVQRLTAQQSRDDRHLALNGKTLWPVPVHARRGPWPALWERSGACPCSKFNRLMAGQRERAASPILRGSTLIAMMRAADLREDKRQGSMAVDCSPHDNHGRDTN
jgi:hypothetical protein